MKNFINLISKLLPDRLFLKLKYYYKFHRKLNLQNPISYNEKIQWLKLYNRNPLYSKMVDKYECKKYVRNLIGEEYIVKNLGVYNKFSDINFESLPDSFVIKCTHDSGGVLVVKNKNDLDWKKTNLFFKKALKRNYYYHNREWPYKNVKPRLLIEENISDGVDLPDYKFFCFDGKVKALFIANNRNNPNEELTFSFYDRDFNELNIVNGHPMPSKAIKKPVMFEKMIEIAEKLSEGIPHLRVDLYEVNGKIYFGELTFSHFGGMMPFEPEVWDYEFGKWLLLPKKP